MRGLRFLLLLLVTLAGGVPAEAGAPPDVDAFSATDLDPSLPNVLLLGDSISVGYAPAVRRRLHGVANVVFLKRNGQPANLGNTRGALYALRRGWIPDIDWAVIHFNFGQNDFVYVNTTVPHGARGRLDKEKGSIATPLDEYVRNLESIVEKLGATGAQLVWASSTVVPDGEPARFTGDETRYNQAADAVMRRNGVIVDDLYSRSASFGPELFVGPKNVHYKAAGSARLAEQVASVIRDALAKRTTPSPAASPTSSAPKGAEPPS